MVLTKFQTLKFNLVEMLKHFKIKFQIKNYIILIFEFDPEVYFLFELDLNFTGWGALSVREEVDKLIYTYERSIIHLVIFRTKFGLRKKWDVVVDNKIKNKEDSNGRS